ncbi:Uncharacterised protein [Vibrio cholerae]|nr:Uncharacterised protein [Vibrio cholerae]
MVSLRTEPLFASCAPFSSELCSHCSNSAEISKNEEWLGMGSSISKLFGFLE